jgi:hypothetical protein
MVSLDVMGPVSTTRVLSILKGTGPWLITIASSAQDDPRRSERPFSRPASGWYGTTIVTLFTGLYYHIPGSLFITAYL